MANQSSVVSQDFVPTEEWPSASVMLEGFGAPTLPDSDKLAGKQLRIIYDTSQVHLRFLDKDRLTWTIIHHDGEEETGTQDYRAVEVRPSIFFIDYLKGENAKQHNISIVVSLIDGKVTTADTGFTNRNGEIRTHTNIISGRLDGMGDIEPRKRSDLLVGKRIYYRYSETEAYEHVYFNAGTVAWQCVKGGEKGVSDVEQMKLFELDDDIVIYIWTETVMPVDSFLVVDLQHNRSIGRMFFWEQTTLDPVHLPFDSNFTVLNTTVYPED